MESTLIISGGILLSCMIGLSWFTGSDAPFVPTKTDLIRKVLKLAGIKKGKRFYELGSGDGRVVFAATKLGAESIGIEQSLLRIIYSRFKAKRLKIDNAFFIHKNIFSRDYSYADIVYIYLLHKGVRRLEGKLKKELKKGSIVITQTYHFSKWRPYKKMEEFWLYRR